MVAVLFVLVHQDYLPNKLITVKSHKGGLKHCKNLIRANNCSFCTNPSRPSIDDIDTEIIAMHYGIVWGKDKEYSHKINRKSCENTFSLSPDPIP